MAATTDKICVIGGGASGIGVGKCLREAGIPFDLLEREDDFGGNWYFDSPSSRVYESAHLISSKSNTQFSDFPMPDDYPAYPNHRLFLRYLRSVASHFDLYDSTRFQTTVAKLEPAGDGWTVTSADDEVLRYRGVVVANGLLREPKWPTYPGRFTGEILHSSQYRTAEQFTGKRVLIVGGGNSGCDQAVDAARTAEHTAHSTRRGYHYVPKFIEGRATQEWLMEISAEFDSSAAFWDHVKRTFKTAGFDGEDYGLPRPDHDIDQAHPIMNSQVLYHIGHGDIAPKPDVESLDGRTVRFQDGSVDEFDLIVYASGYTVSLPFIDPSVVDWRDGMAQMFLNALPLDHDDIVFAGYFNIPSGYGNLANTCGRLIAAYFKARSTGAPPLEVFRRLKHRMREIDLGRDQFMSTDRHKHELDLWKYIRVANFLRGKLEGGGPEWAM